MMNGTRRDEFIKWTNDLFSRQTTGSTIVADFCLCIGNVFRKSETVVWETCHRVHSYLIGESCHGCDLTLSKEHV